MSKRTSIVKALVAKLKLINGNSPYTVNIFNNAFPILKFWNEVTDFPSVYMTAGPEYRNHLPSNFTWVTTTICIKVYCKGEDAQTQLEDLLDDIETAIDLNRQLKYDASNPSYETTEILVKSIVTDEGLLAPYAVGEITAEVLYPKM